LSGVYWTEVDKKGKATLHVDATVAWKKSPPKMFGWGIATDSKKYKMERVAVTSRGQNVKTYKEKCSIWGDKKEKRKKIVNCYGKKGGKKTDHWRSEELLTGRNKLRLHAVRELVPKGEKNPHFRWKQGSVKNWSAYLNTGKANGYSEMSMRLYLSDTPGYEWWNVLGMSNIAVFIILFLLTIVTLTFLKFCHMRKKYLTEHVNSVK